MIKSLTVTNYRGASAKIILNEYDPAHGFIIQSIDGLGPAKADINTTSLATRDGTMYNSAKLQERNIVLKLYLGYTPKIEDARQNTYKYFPIKKKVDLVIETDNRTLKTSGYVESNEPDIFSNMESTQISIICPDPYLYDASTGKQITNFAGINAQFEFPFENNSLEENLIEFASIEMVTSQNVLYEGDIETGIIITIHALGTASMITFANDDTNESMIIDTDKLEDIIGSPLRASDDIIISTVKGNKYVRFLRDGQYTNIINCVGRDTDWFQLSKGDNVFSFSADSGAENIQIKIENNILYEGV